MFLIYAPVLSALYHIKYQQKENVRGVIYVVSFVTIVQLKYFVVCTHAQQNTPNPVRCDDALSEYFNSKLLYHSPSSQKHLQVIW